MFRLALLCTFFAILASCTSAIEYSPAKMDDKDAALKMLERLLYEQPRGDASNNVVVTKEFFRSVKSNTKGVSLTETVYFDNVSSITLFERKKCAVDLQDKAGFRIFRYSSQDIEKAKKFADVISTLKGE
jgi:hypothetical protein